MGGRASQVLTLQKGGRKKVLVVVLTWVIEGEGSFYFLKGGYKKV